MRIGFRIASGFTVTLLIAGGVGLIGYFGLTRYDRDITLTLHLLDAVDTFRGANAQADLYAFSREQQYFDQAITGTRTTNERLSSIVSSGETDPAIAIMNEEVASYQAKLEELHSVNTETKAITASMAAEAEEIKGSAAKLSAAAADAFKASHEAEATAAENRESSIAVMNASNALLANGNAIRAAEAAYRLERTDGNKSELENGTKRLFLDALSLRKSAKGTAAEPAAGKVAQLTVAYRKLFSALVEDIADGGSQALALFAELSETSKALTQTAQDILKDRATALTEANEQYAQAKDRGSEATNARIAALEMVIAADNMATETQSYIVTTEETDRDQCGSFQSFLESACREKSASGRIREDRHRSSKGRQELPQPCRYSRRGIGEAGRNRSRDAQGRVTK